MASVRYAVHVGGVMLGTLSAFLVLLAVAVAAVFDLAAGDVLFRGFALGCSLWLGAMVFGVMMNG